MRRHQIWWYSISSGLKDKGTHWMLSFVSVGQLEASCWMTVDSKVRESHPRPSLKRGLLVGMS